MNPQRAVDVQAFPAHLLHNFDEPLRRFALDEVVPRARAAFSIGEQRLPDIPRAVETGEYDLRDAPEPGVGNQLQARDVCIVVVVHQADVHDSDMNVRAAQ